MSQVGPPWPPWAASTLQSHLPCPLCRQRVQTGIAQHIGFCWIRTRQRKCREIAEMHVALQSHRDSFMQIQTRPAPPHITHQ